MSKYGVISGPYFPEFVLNMEIYCLNTGKFGPEITLYLNTFHAVIPTAISGGVDISEVPGCHLLRQMSSQ